MTASQRRTVTVLVAALGVAFVLAWGAAAGPDQVIHGGPAQSVTDQADHPTSPGRGTEPDDVVHRSDPPTSHRTMGAWIQDLAAFALLVAGLFVIGLLLRQLFLRIRRGLPDERLVVPLDPLPDLDVAREAVRRDEQRQYDALTGSDVRNGIVACWVIFEEAAAEANLAKQPAETASAFVVRFLHVLDVDPRPVGVLAQLFLEARFSTHPMPPGARAQAQEALAAIHLDLAVTGAAP